MQKTLMIYNGDNPVHRAFGDSVNAVPYVIRERVMKKQFAPVKMLRLLKNSLSVPRGFPIILAESAYYYPAIKKRAHLLDSKIVNINCGPLIFNILKKRLGGMERAVLLSLLKEVSGHLVLGEYGREILNKADPGKPLRVVYPFVSDNRMNALKKLKISLNANNITILATNDIHCKGLDIAIEAFNKVFEKRKDVVLNIAGNVDIAKLRGLNLKKSGRIRFLGVVTDVAALLARTSLYIQPSRGDTFPVASLEAMAAGIPTIVSEETGTKEVVEKVRKDFVVPLNSAALANKIIEYFEMREDEKRKLGEEFRKAAEPFNEKEQLENFKKQFLDLVREIQ
jgi:glycosyltransferase involved in cell wall biosynthesis